ncbi:MAG TPA: hypothetical protein VMV83_14560 [Rectinemataceae bacterium]|nr:hypothetical protein [Rectinemataceae bacterium]
MRGEGGRNRVSPFARAKVAAWRGGRIGDLLRTLLFLGLSFCAVQLAPQTLALAPTALPTTAPSGTAILISGPDRVLGLPFFSPNSIPALRGTYLIGVDRLPVWFTREALFFGTEWGADDTWAPGSGLRALTQKAAEGRVDLALRKAGWSVIFELPSTDPALRRFVRAFMDRFGFFLENAGSDSALSFPATVAY